MFAFRKLAMASLGCSSLAWCLPKIDESMQLPASGLAQPSPTDPRVYVIIGHGPASYTCAYTLRSEGFTGKIVMVAESAPINSFALGRQVPSTKLDEKVLSSVEMKQGSVASIDAKTSTVCMSDGFSIQYHKLCVARDPSLKVPAMLENAYKNLENVITLETEEDHQKLISNGETKNLVFTGLNLKTIEVISWMNASITVIEPDSESLEKVLGYDISREVLMQLRKKGVRLLTGTLSELVSDGSKATHVKIEHLNEFWGKSTEDIPADLVVIPEAKTFNNYFLPSELLNCDGSIPVDLHMKTANSNIYAAGESIKALDIQSEEKCNLKGANSALSGAYAASNMMGKPCLYTDVAMRSINIGVQVDIIGNTEMHDWIWTQKIEHDIMVTYFFKNKKCIGVVVYNFPVIGEILRLALQNGQIPSLHHSGKELTVESIVSSNID